MAPAFVTSEEQLRFLVTCIKSAPEFKPNWETVAKEMELSSGSAAQQRYGRMLTKFGKKDDLKDSNAAVDESPANTKTTKKKRSRKPKTKNAAEEGGEDEEGGKEAEQPPAKKMKRANPKAPTGSPVKVEQEDLA